MGMTTARFTADTTVVPPRVYYLMRYVKSEPTSSDVYLWSPAPASVLPGYHKILGAAKGWRTTPPSWGYTGGRRSVGKMLPKLAYWGSRSLYTNDLFEQGQREIAAPGANWRGRFSEKRSEKQQRTPREVPF
jgi:hypothetical protein